MAGYPTYRHDVRNIAGVPQKEYTASVRALTAKSYLALRTLTSCLSPDKNQGVKGAHDRFSRLGVVAKILRDREGRERYVLPCMWRLNPSWTLQIRLFLQEWSTKVERNGLLLF